MVSEEAEERRENTLEIDHSLIFVSFAGLCCAYATPTWSSVPSSIALYSCAHALAHCSQPNKGKRTGHGPKSLGKIDFDVFLKVRPKKRRVGKTHLESERDMDERPLSFDEAASFSSRTKKKNA